MLQPRYHVQRPEDCRCPELRETFGAGAPRECFPCSLRRRVLELHEAGYVEIPQAHLQSYRAFGVPVQTTMNRKAWAPSWAVMIVDHFAQTHDLEPILARASVDHEFAEAVMTILMQAESDAATRVRAFAIMQGVDLLSLAR